MSDESLQDRKHALEDAFYREGTEAYRVQLELRRAEEEANRVADPHGLFLRGNVAFADCLVAEKQAATAAAEPFAFDVAIALADKAARLWADAAMSREDWPAARRNVERALLKAAELRRRKSQAEQQRRPDPKPQPKPNPKPQPEGKKKVTEEDPDLDPVLIRNGNRMGLFYCLIMLPAVAVSFFNPVLSFLIYGIIVAAFILATALGRAEVATLWPTVSE